MSVIEGIGDDVTVLAGVLVLAITLLVAWLSTSVSDRAGVRTTSPRPSDTSVAGEQPHSVEPSAGIEEVDVLNRSGGTENARTESDGSVLTGTTSTDISYGTQNARNQVLEGENTDAASGRSEDRTSLEETDLGRTERSTASQDNAKVPETLPQSVVRNRLTGETCIYPTSSENTNTSQSIPSSTTSIQKEDSQSGDATQTGPDEDAQSELLLEQSAGNRADSDQSDAQTQSDGQEQTPEGAVCIRIKYLTDRERVVYADPTEILSSFRQRTFSEEINSGQTVRLIFNGHLLQDDNSTLADLNLTQNCVIHCLLSQRATPSNAGLDVQETDVDLGRFMIPLFTCILGFVWYLRWQYRYMFNATSTLSLVGVTTLFILAVLASWRG